MVPVKAVLDAALDERMTLEGRRPEIELEPEAFYLLAKQTGSQVMEDEYLDHAEGLREIRHKMFAYRGCIFFTALKYGPEWG